MKRFFAFLVAVFLYVSAHVPLAAEDFPSLEPTFTYTAQSDLLTGEDVIRAGLEFSLCPQGSALGMQSLAAYRELEKIVTGSEFQSLSQLELGEKILALMYEHVLKQYVSNQTNIDVMFAEGTYNCVSSSVLYFALARAAGLTVTGQETPNHAFCTVYIDGKKIDVETTNPGGFNPGTKKVVEQTANSTRYFMVPKKYYSGRKEIGERKFVSLVGRNLVSDMNDNDDFARGVPLSVARMVFVQSAPAKDTAEVRADFDTLAGNYAIVLDRQKDAERALIWLDAVYARWGKGSATLQKNYDTVAYNCAVYYLRDKEFERAHAVFSAHKAQFSPKNAAAIETMIFTAYIDDAVEKRSPDEAIAFLHEQRNHPLATEKSVASRLNEQEEFAWYQKIKPLVDAGDYLSAAALADEALAYVPNSRNLKTIKNQCLQNYAVDVHNEFADLANAGNYQEALAVIQAGLVVVPNNATLKNDLKRLQTFMNR